MVKFNYDLDLNKIQILNIDGVMKNSAFSSSFFNIEFDPDELSYTVGDDYMYFGMIIAPRNVPSVFIQKITFQIKS